MSDYDQKDLRKKLLTIGINKGDSVFLTTSLGTLGAPKTQNKNLMLTSSEWVLHCLKEIIGKKGNIFVPTYSYTFTKKNKIFDIKKTKADIGYFPNFFLKQKKIIRSPDPMFSVAGHGPDAKDILNKISDNSFGNNCVFERLLKLKHLKCCNIGLGYNWIPFLHYLDWKNKVPFRFDKKFFGYIKKKNKKKLTWVFFSRLQRKETISNGYKIGYRALKNKLYKKTQIGRSMIYIIDYKKFFNFSKKITKKNKWLTVNGPKFKIQIEKKN
jgi:aminoglycoside N3'-acetyltransferase